MNPKRTAQEETYLLSDAEHAAGSSIYKFTFSPHWRSIVNQKLSIGVRSVKLLLSPRTIFVEGLSIKNGSQIAGATPDGERQYWNISPTVIMTSSWSQLNDELQKDKEFKVNLLNDDQKKVFNSSSYAIKYNPADNTLIIAVGSTDNHYLVLDSDAVVSSDFKALTDTYSDNLWTDLSSCSQGRMTPNTFNQKWSHLVEVLVNSNGLIMRILFKKLATRENIKINASFVDLAFHQYLGITNEQFVPPKEYDINYSDNKFWIRLCTLNDHDAEMAPDGKDQLVIEAIMYSS